MVLIGDFNARTGNLADLSLSPNDDVSLDQLTHSENFLNCDLCIDSSDLQLSNIQVERNNKDSKTNDFGHRLIEICQISGLMMCNGRIEGDNKKGEFTYVDKKGKSTVDYA